MNQDNNQGPLRNNQKTVNDPPLFSGTKRDFDGFITRAEITMEANPQYFNNDRARVRFIISYLTGDPLSWASNLRRNNDPLLENYENFIQELKKSVWGTRHEHCCRER